MLSIRNLYFIDSNGNYRLLASDVNEAQAWKVATDFLKDHNFEMYYCRTFMTNEGTIYDVGSHTEFFLWGFEKKC